MLEKILSHTAERLAGIDSFREIKRIMPYVASLPPVRSLSESLRSEKGVSIIAEIKRRSPSKGMLNAKLDVVETARLYEQAGARAISVLTEEKFFGGSIEDLVDARQCVSLPVLRKDFVLDEYQVWHSRFIGADAILLIAAAVGFVQLTQLFNAARRSGLEVLVEVHSQEELEQVLMLSPDLIGVNSRNLRTFEVDLGVAESLSHLVPENVVCVSESGIRSRDDVLRMEQAGVDAVLVGERLVTAADTYSTIRQLRGVS